MVMMKKMMTTMTTTIMMIMVLFTVFSNSIKVMKWNFPNMVSGYRYPVSDGSMVRNHTLCISHLHNAGRCCSGLC